MISIDSDNETQTLNSLAMETQSREQDWKTCRVTASNTENDISAWNYK